MFREAVMLHYLDDLDSKMGAIRSVLGSERGEQEWTDRSGALDRRLLRVERYVNAATPAETVVVARNGRAAFADPYGGAKRSEFRCRSNTAATRPIRKINPVRQAILASPPRPRPDLQGGAHSGVSCSSRSERHRQAAAFRS